MKKEKIKEEMARLNLSRADIMKDCLVHESQLSRYLTGKLKVPNSWASCFKWYFEAKSHEVAAAEALERDRKAIKEAISYALVRLKKISAQSKINLTEQEQALLSFSEKIDNHP